MTSDVIVARVGGYACSVRFFSRPRYDGWPHHGRCFSSKFSRRKLSAERDGSRSRTSCSKGPTTEHGTPVSRYEQLMAAGGPQTHTHTHTHTTITLLRTASTRRAASTFCSVLQPSWIRRLATPWTYFLHLSLSSVILTDSSTGSPVHILMLSIQAARGRICICTAI